MLDFEETADQFCRENDVPIELKQTIVDLLRRAFLDGMANAADMADHEDHIELMEGSTGPEALSEFAKNVRAAIGKRG